MQAAADCNLTATPQVEQVALEVSGVSGFPVAGVVMGSLMDLRLGPNRLAVAVVVHVEILVRPHRLRETTERPAMTMAEGSEV